MQRHPHHIIATALVTILACVVALVSYPGTVVI